MSMFGYTMRAALCIRQRSAMEISVLRYDSERATYLRVSATIPMHGTRESAALTWSHPPLRIDGK
jgi:hypothetical protein